MTTENPSDREELDRARAILAAEADAIQSIRLDEAFLKAVDALQKCSGKVVTTGMGKVGIIARKIAATLSSTGTPSCFLHPGEAAHGDLGVVSKHDILIIFSNSGETNEVVRVIQCLKEIYKIQIITITGHSDSSIALESDIVLGIGSVKEPCPLEITPSASTTAMLALGDTLALVLMKRKGFTIEEFAKFHHGGYLGKQISLGKG